MTAGKALSVEYRPIDSLVPYERNARTHSQEQVRQLVAAITEFGWTNPVLVDEQSRVIAGHGRLLAAREMAMQQVPVIEIRGLSDAQRRALTLADNKLALNAGWDVGRLTDELAALREIGYDATLAGFSVGELMDLLSPASGKDPDAVPDVPKTPKSKMGDVYTLGRHRLICGDSCEAAVLQRLMRSEQADVCWTDPPYNVAYEGAAGSIKNDSMSDARFKQFLVSCFSGLIEVMKPGASIYVAHADTEGLNFRSAFSLAGFKISGCLIWRKDALVLGRSDYQWQHEPILYGWRPGRRHRWFGGRKQTTVMDFGEPFTRNEDGTWQIIVGDRVMTLDGDVKVQEDVSSLLTFDRPKRSDEHPTMKPVGLIERMLKNSARPGDVVIDVFGGSGSTLIAAERLGMAARLVELDPRFVDVIVGRWEAFTGQQAVLERLS